VQCVFHGQMVSGTLVVDLLRRCNGKETVKMIGIGMLRRKLSEDYEILGTWDAVARKWGVSKGMAWRLANESGYEPKNPTIRKKLGLRRRGPRRDLFAMGEVELLRALEEREWEHE